MATGWSGGSSRRTVNKESKVEKAKKAEVVEDLNGVFSKAGSVVVAHYSGMTVAQMADLRSRMGAAGASFRVAKNRLAVRALKGTPIEGIAHLFKGPTGIAVSDDPIAASKVVAAYAKVNDKLGILGGSFFFNATATTEIYTLSLHDALPISLPDALLLVPTVHRDERGFFVETYRRE